MSWARSGGSAHGWSDPGGVKKSSQELRARVGPMIVERIKSMLEACEAGTAAFPPSGALQRGLAAADHPRLVRAPRRRPVPAVAAARRAMVLAGVAAVGVPVPVSRRPTRRGADACRRRARPLRHRRSRHGGAVADAGARQLVVLEAKLFARFLGRRAERPLLRPGGAERRVHRRDPPPRRAVARRMEELAFIVLAPQARLDDGIFEWDRGPRGHPPQGPPPRRGLRRRARSLVPRLVRADLAADRGPLAELGRRHRDRSRSTSLEDGTVIDSFYGQCLRFNRPRAGRLLPRAPFPARPRAEASPPLPVAAHGAS